MAVAFSYRQGRIIFAYLRSQSTGKMQRHPAIMLDLDQDITQPENFDPRKTLAENIVHVIGVSTKHKFYDQEYIQLPFSSSGHALTKLREDCGAIIGWYHRVAIPDDVIGFGGDVPAPTMLAINYAVRKDLARKLGTELDMLKHLFDELYGAAGE